MHQEIKPLHQIQLGDTIAYYQAELRTEDRKQHHREGLYTATVLKKIPYTLVLTSGELLPRANYRVVISESELVSTADPYQMPSRAAGKTFKGVSIE